MSSHTFSTEDIAALRRDAQTVIDAEIRFVWINPVHVLALLDAYDAANERNEQFKADNEHLRQSLQWIIDDRTRQLDALQERTRLTAEEREAISMIRARENDNVDGLKADNLRLLAIVARLTSADEPRSEGKR